MHLSELLDEVKSPGICLVLSQDSKTQDNLRQEKFSPRMTVLAKNISGVSQLPETLSVELLL